MMTVYPDSRALCEYENIICCIYKIYNTSNDREYIGQTTNLDIRIRQHLFDLRNKKHSNRYLQFDFDKMGIGVFEVHIVKTFDRLHMYTPRQIKGRLYEAERIQIEYSPKCYNIREGVIIARRGGPIKYDLDYRKKYKTI